MIPTHRGIPLRKVPLLLLLAVLFMSCTSVETQRAPRPIELRGVWLTSEDEGVFESRESIAAAMEFLSQHHFNVVFPDIWRESILLFRSDRMRENFGIEINPRYSDRDPLAELIEEAHKRNIAVIPQFGSGFGTSSEKDGGIILQRKPHWAARDREGKLVMKEGIAWMNGLHPEVQEFMLSLVSEVVKNYNIDGIQGSERFPAQPIESGYDSLTQALYADVHAGNLPPLDIHEIHWKYWRAVRLTAFAQRLYWTAKALKPNAIVSWTTKFYPQSLNENLQDWRSWISEGVNKEYYGDLLHPRIFLDNIQKYKRTLDAQHRDSLKIQQPKRYMYPGLRVNKGGYLVSEEFLKEAIRYNRLCGYNGEVFFSYEGLRKGNDKLAKVLKETYYKTPATLPFTPSFWQEHLLTK
jgi:uncharacterized lipoprotein YddW (UPF0748 family)